MKKRMRRKTLTLFLEVSLLGSVELDDGLDFLAVRATRGGRRDDRRSGGRSRRRELGGCSRESDSTRRRIDHTLCRGLRNVSSHWL